MKTGRNDPCPCGSGKKYKKCCIDKDNIIQFPQENRSQNSPNDKQMMNSILQSAGFSSEKAMDSSMKEYEDFCQNLAPGDYIPSLMEFMGRSNSASNVLGEIKNNFSMEDFPSIDEANIALEGLTNKRNNAPKVDFLGLSSVQMQQILSKDIPSNKNLVRINAKITNEDVINTRIVSLSLFFLQMLLDNSGSLLLTSTGNLILKHCNTFLNFIFPGMPGNYGAKSEVDVPDLSTIRLIMDETGYIETLKTRIKLTEKGFILMEQKDLSLFYLDILDYYAERYEWLSMFRFNDQCSIVQDSVLFSLYILHKKAKKFISQDRLYDYFHRAFPFISDIPVLTSGLNIMPKVYDILFLSLFCRYFGLVDTKLDNSGDSKFMYKTSKLFDKLFDWE